MKSVKAFLKDSGVQNLLQKVQLLPLEAVGAVRAAPPQHKLRYLCVTRRNAERYLGVAEARMRTEASVWTFVRWTNMFSCLHGR